MVFVFRGVARSSKVGWTIRGGVWREMSPTSTGEGTPVGRWVWGYAPSWEKNFPFEIARFDAFLASWCGLLWCNSLQFWCVHTVTNRFYYRNWLTCTAIWNGLHWQIICKPKIPANRQTTTLEWIDSLSSTRVRFMPYLRSPTTI